MIKKLLFVILFFNCSFINTKAQYLLGIANSNFAGTNGVYMNPSSIADSRQGFYFNFFTVESHLSNNYLKINSVPKFIREITEENFILNSRYLDERLDGKPKMFSVGADIRGPSLMVKMSPRHSFAITTRSRTSIQGFDISEDFIRLLRTGTNNIALQNKLNSNSNFRFITNSFAEVGLTYGRTIIENRKHFLKGGFTLKRLMGIYSAYAFNDDFDYTIKEDANGDRFIQVDNINARYGYSSGEPELFTRNIFDNWNNGSWGFDFGFTYEYRPRYADHVYAMDGMERWNGRENRYKYKIGIALVDIGNVNYTSSSLRQYRINRSSFSFNPQQYSEASAEELDELIFNTFNPQLQPSTTYKSGLPTALNLNLDYRMAKKLYLNLTWIQSVKSTEKIAVKANSMIGLTPRVELKGFEFAIPISLQNNYKSSAIGAMLRLGPLFFGSDNLKGLVLKKTDGVDFYLGLALPIAFRKKADKDGDGVSDAKDACNTVPGKWEFRGCPDSDNDGVADSDDACPAEAGLKQFGGCPDTDGDGIINTKDNCPTEKGLPQFGGCPDKDGDGIMDKEDNCPENKGLAKFKGCPDSDNDGVPDSDDACPNIKGLTTFKGCPDTDNDGVADKDDSCPQVKGSINMKGCPDADNDGITDTEDECPNITGIKTMKGCPDGDNDGVADKDDKCPDVFGSITNNGCPVDVSKMQRVELSNEEAKAVKEAFDNLEFETGKAIIKETSLSSLEELAEVLNSKAEYRLLVSGHTDNIGNPVTNVKLSKSRAEAVKNYLISIGVIPDKIITEGMGSKKPIASNSNVEGRQKNRRVEMKVIK